MEVPSGWEADERFLAALPPTFPCAFESLLCGGGWVVKRVKQWRKWKKFPRKVVSKSFGVDVTILIYVDVSFLILYQHSMGLYNNSLRRK